MIAQGIGVDQKTLEVGTISQKFGELLDVLVEPQYVSYHTCGDPFCVSANANDCITGLSQIMKTVVITRRYEQEQQTGITREVFTKQIVACGTPSEEQLASERFRG